MVWVHNLHCNGWPGIFGLAWPGGRVAVNFVQIAANFKLYLHICLEVYLPSTLGINRSIQGRIHSPKFPSPSSSSQLQKHPQPHSFRKKKEKSPQLNNMRRANISHLAAVAGLLLARASGQLEPKGCATLDVAAADDNNAMDVNSPEVCAKYCNSNGYPYLALWLQYVPISPPSSPRSALN